LADVSRATAGAPAGIGLRRLELTLDDCAGRGFIRMSEGLIN
jgi:hypothetical protein